MNGLRGIAEQVEVRDDNDVVAKIDHTVSIEVGESWSNPVTVRRAPAWARTCHVEVSNHLDVVGQIHHVIELDVSIGQSNVDGRTAQLCNRDILRS